MLLADLVSASAEVAATPALSAKVRRLALLLRGASSDETPTAAESAYRGR